MKTVVQLSVSDLNDLIKKHIKETHPKESEGKHLKIDYDINIVTIGYGMSEEDIPVFEGVSVEITPWSAS